MSGGCDAWIGVWRERVERALADRLPAPEEPDGSLAEAMRYAVMSGGKRLRPLLVLASAVAAGGREEPALSAAAAIELIHTYSLVHDDLPAMDDDALRRGKPTVHVRFGEAIAVLVGDALQSLAFEVLADAPLPAESVRRQVAALARAAGRGGMAGGQALDLLAEQTTVGGDGVERIHRLKTGALIGAAFRLGAQAAGGNDELAARFERIGLDVGLAFQIQDDILDRVASTARLGKTAGKDLAAGKATWPAVFGLDASRRRRSELLDRSQASLAPLGEAGQILRALVHRAVERDA